VVLCGVLEAARHQGRSRFYRTVFFGSHRSHDANAIYL
jgi:hypothetical protein